MIASDNVFFHFLQPQFRIIIASLIAASFNTYAISVIIRITRAKQLYYNINVGMPPSKSISVFGGLGIFITIVSVCLTFINTCGMYGGCNTGSLTSLPPIIAGFTLIFFLGFKIDLLNISPYKKITAELLALVILIVIGDVRLNSMQGMFNIGELSYSVSIILSLMAGIVIINAFNMIDSIDGLAISITILGCIVFGSYFILISELEYAVLSFTILGTLVPNLYYSFFVKTTKIILGDTGSLLLGFAMTVLVFRFNQTNSLPSVGPVFAAAPAFSFSVILLPVFTTLWVFTLRSIYRSKYSFKEDRRHIHNIILNLGCTHLQSTLLLSFINLAFIAFAYFFNFLGNSILVYIMITAALFLSTLAIWLQHNKLYSSPK